MLPLLLTLTDILTCPRCGPGFPLILLADRVEERRVIEGILGCSNCRERYPIRRGMAALGAAPALAEQRDDPGELMRLAALLGVTHGPASILLAGPAAGQAGKLAGMLEDVEVIAAAFDAGGSDVAEPRGVSVLGFAGPRIPLGTAKVQAVALTGGAAALVEEGARVLAVTGRLVLDPAPADAATRLAAAGLRVLAQQGSTLVAGRVG